MIVKDFHSPRIYSIFFNDVATGRLSSNVITPEGGAINDLLFSDLNILAIVYQMDFCSRVLILVHNHSKLITIDGLLFWGLDILGLYIKWSFAPGF
jgi:hypothetical protein